MNALSSYPIVQHSWTIAKLYQRTEVIEKSVSMIERSEVMP